MRIIKCNGGINGDFPTEISYKDVNDAIRALLKIKDDLDEKTFKKEEDKWGAQPLITTFLGICHTDLIPSLENLTYFIPSNKYPSPNSPLPDELGSIGNIRFLTKETSNDSIIPNSSSLGKNIYVITIYGVENDTKLDHWSIALHATI